MRRAIAPTVAVLALVGLSCGDDNKGPTEPVITAGSIEVLLTMTGSYLDGDGCQVSLDGGESRLLEQESPVIFADVSQGSHTLALDGVAANCSIAGENPRDVEVVAGQTAQTTYGVECTPCGAGYGPYVAVDLGILPPGEVSTAYDINNLGQVVGLAERGGGFLWQDGEMVPLGDRIGAGVAINDHGQVAILVGPGGELGHAYFWEQGVATDLGTLEGDERSNARDINNLGQVVGHSEANGFLWANGTMIDLGMVGSVYAKSIPTAINDGGQVVGLNLTHHPQRTRAFLWEDGVMTDLGSPGGPDSEALDINNRGQVLVWSGERYVPSSVYHYYLWEDGVMKELDAGFSPQVINNCGQVAGSEHIWEDGVLTRFRVHEPYDGTPFDVGINDAGQVVGSKPTGQGCDYKWGCYHATLWTRSY